MTAASKALLECRNVDVIGDVHGCAGELRLLLDYLGYREHAGHWSHPGGRVAVFLGDLVDRGPRNVETLLLVDQMVQDGCALIGSIGNHDIRLYEKLILGIEPSKRAGGLPATLEEIDADPEREQVVAAVERLFAQAPAFTCFDGGRLLVVHAAMRPELLEVSPASDRLDALSQLCSFGETNGEVDEAGRKVLSSAGWRCGRPSRQWCSAITSAGRGRCATGTAT